MRPSLHFNVAFIAACFAIGSLTASAADTKAVDSKGKAAATKPNSASVFMPTAQDLSDPASAETKTQEIKNSRWVQPSQLNAPTKEKTPSKGNKLSLTASCTDASGKTFTSTDDGYAGCIQQVSASSQEAKAQSGVVADKKPSDSKAAASAGFQFKFGE